MVFIDIPIMGEFNAYFIITNSDCEKYWLG